MKTIILFFLFISKAADAASPCTFESLCQKFGEGYENQSGYRVRRALPKDFNRTIFEQKAKSSRRIERIFADAKRRLIQVLKNEPLLIENVRKQMMARVMAANLTLQAGSDDFSSLYVAVFWSDSFEVLTVYSAVEMPEANLLNLFAHELSHSFDENACYYSLVKEGNQIYENDESKNPSNGKREILSTPFAWSDLSPLTSLVLGMGAQEAHLSESVADYFARAVSAAYLSELPPEEQSAAVFEGQMDLILSGCRHPESIDQGTLNYPSFRTRVEAIYFSHPTIAKLAGCLR